MIRHSELNWFARKFARIFGGHFLIRKADYEKNVKKVVGYVSTFSMRRGELFPLASLTANVVNLPKLKLVVSPLNQQLIKFTIFLLFDQKETRHMGQECEELTVFLEVVVSCSATFWDNVV